MRLSTLPDDVAYATPDVTREYRAFLDDVEQEDVVTADEEMGLIVAFQIDENGRPRLSPDREDILTEERRGVVRLERMPPEEPVANRMVIGGSS